MRLNFFNHYLVSLVLKNIKGRRNQHHLNTIGVSTYLIGDPPILIADPDYQWRTQAFHLRSFKFLLGHYSLTGFIAVAVFPGVLAFIDKP